MPSVLVVEDEALLLITIADELRDFGYVVFEATNADRAIEILEAQPDIGILFTDFNMPGSMDGLKLSMAVRKRWPPVKIIVTSGKVGDNGLTLPLGGVFMPKPYTADAVQARIEELLAS
jgi:CheY-like chemotaxis protein